MHSTQVNDPTEQKLNAADTVAADWKHIDKIADKGAMVGCDYAGIVEEVGNKVTSDVKVGDAIFGITHGANDSNHEDGCFAEHCVAKDGMFAKKAPQMSLEEAATYGVGVTTCGQGLYQSLKLPMPNEPTKTAFPVLIYGGSTATGTLAIQFAKMSGLTVLTTASKHNHQLLDTLGADACFDYKDSDCAEQIRKYTKNSLHYVFDCVSEKGSVKICADSLASEAPAGGLHYSALLYVQDFPRKDVNFRFTMAYTALGEEYAKFGHTSPPIVAHYDFSVKFWKLSGELIATGKLKPHPRTVGKGGLEGVMEGIRALREDKVSGQKLVYPL